MRTLRMTAGGIAIAASISIMTATTVSGTPKPPLFDGVPGDAFRADGSIDPKSTPDYVAVGLRDGSGLAGYIARDDLFNPSYPANPAQAAQESRAYETDRVGHVRARRLRVVDENLKLVGWWYDEIGFVSLGEHSKSGFDIARLLPPAAPE